MTRRDLLGAVPAAMLAAPVPGVQLGCQTNAWPIRNFAEFLGVLNSIRRLEFTGFETSFRNLLRLEDLAGARKKIEAAGLVFTGVHIFLQEYDKETAVAPWDLIERTVLTGQALGARSLILSGRSVGSDRDAARRKAAALARAARFCGIKGLRAAYHNHNLEFRDGAAEMEILLAGSDPAGLVLDAGHAFVAGVDPVAFFTRYPTRIQGMHLRDFKSGKQVPLGQGEFDLAPLAAAIVKARWRGWILAEEERPNDVRPGESVVAPARRHLRKIFGM
jgi:inosose dehydratase